MLCIATSAFACLPKEFLISHEIFRFRAFVCMFFFLFCSALLFVLFFLLHRRAHRIYRFSCCILTVVSNGAEVLLLSWLKNNKIYLHAHTHIHTRTHNAIWHQKERAIRETNAFLSLSVIWSVKASMYQWKFIEVIRSPQCTRVKATYIRNT